MHHARVALLCLPVRNRRLPGTIYPFTDMTRLLPATLRERGDRPAIWRNPRIGRAPWVGTGRRPSCRRLGRRRHPRPPPAAPHRCRLRNGSGTTLRTRSSPTPDSSPASKPRGTQTASRTRTASPARSNRRSGEGFPRRNPNLRTVPNNRREATVRNGPPYIVVFHTMDDAWSQRVAYE